MQVDKDKLNGFLEKARFKTHGDAWERKYGGLIVPTFPACEKLWSHLVVPMTERMVGYPGEPSPNPEHIHPRTEPQDLVRDLGAIHYSLFLNLVFAHSHRLQAGAGCSFEDFWAHLGTACDLAEAFLERTYLEVKTWRGEPVQTLQEMTKEEFQAITGDWYDRHYQDFYDHYLSRGRGSPLRIPGRRHLVREFLGYLNGEDLWTEWERKSKRIRVFRNAVMHDVRIGRLITLDERVVVPKPERIRDYRTWRAVFEAAKDPERLRNDFAPAEVVHTEVLDGLETCLNRIWARVSELYLEELFSDQRTGMREALALEFT